MIIAVVVDCRQQSHKTRWWWWCSKKSLVEGTHVSYGWFDQDDHSSGGRLPIAIAQNPLVVVVQIKYLVEGDCRQQLHTTVAVVQIKCLVEGSHVSYGWLDQDDNSRGGRLPTAITQNPKVVVVQMKCLVEGMSHGWLYQDDHSRGGRWPTAIAPTRRWWWCRGNALLKVPTSYGLFDQDGQIWLGWLQTKVAHKPKVVV